MSTLISWSDEVWNPTTGCDRVSPGCANCYAMKLAARYRENPRMQALGIYQKDGGRASGPGFGLTLRPEVLDKPLHWRAPRRIFVNSMSDLFHEDVPANYIAKCFGIMAQAPQHTFQILTKRIEIAHSILSSELFLDRVIHSGEAGTRIPKFTYPLPNVIIGPTVENQAMANKRLPVLRQIHALGWRTMVSYEPALGPVDFAPWLGIPLQPWHEWRECLCEEIDPADKPCTVCELRSCIDWLICGGESGSGRRPFEHGWMRSALGQARSAGVPFFAKQDGAYKSEVFKTLPEELQVREFPA